MTAAPSQTIDLPVDSPASVVWEMLRTRLTAVLLLLACGALLFTSWILDPSPAGHGTHKQLGLAACGFQVRWGIPCPTCGMTTAFAHAADGQLLSAFRVQPAGLLLAIGNAALFITAIWGLITGGNVGRVLQSLLTRGPVVVVLAAVAVTWIVKIGMVTT